MPKTTLLIGAALVILIGGTLLLQQRGALSPLFPSSATPPAETQMRNAEVLASPGRYTVTTSTINYFENANGFLAKPAEPGEYPGVVMIHENRGINDFVRQMAEQLAKEGYIVLAVDLFGRSVETQEEARGLTSEYDQQKGIENMRAAAQYLRDQGATKIASLGWCFGGGQSMQLALSGEPMDATVIYYGQLVTDSNQLRKISWPVLGIFGDQDQVISVDSVNSFDKALDDLDITNEVYIYPGVGHAFANPSGMNYAPEQTQDAWDKTLTFLNKHLVTQ